MKIGKNYKYVVVNERTIDGERREVYWTGEQRLRSDRKTPTPKETMKVQKAKRFEAAREAYEVAGYCGLQDWRVGLRRVE